MPRRKRPDKNDDASCVINVRVVPRSSQIKILEEAPNQYKIKLTAPPVDQAANQQLLKVLADRLSVSPARIEIITGAQARTKRVRIHGLSETQLASRLVRQ